MRIPFWINNCMLDPPPYIWSLSHSRFIPPVFSVKSDCICVMGAWPSLLLCVHVSEQMYSVIWLVNTWWQNYLDQSNDNTHSLRCMYITQQRWPFDLVRKIVWFSPKVYAKPKPYTIYMYLYVTESSENTSGWVDPGPTWLSNRLDFRPSCPATLWLSHPGRVNWGKNYNDNIRLTEGRTITGRRRVDPGWVDSGQLDLHSLKLSTIT